jgi:hypothetical protein
MDAVFDTVSTGTALEIARQLPHEVAVGLSGQGGFVARKLQQVGTGKAQNPEFEQ